jgi:hypothetical protein
MKEIRRNQKRRQMTGDNNIWQKVKTNEDEFIKRVVLKYMWRNYEKY